MDITPKQVLDLSAKYIDYKEKSSGTISATEDSKWIAY